MEKGFKWIIGILVAGFIGYTAYEYYVYYRDHGGFEGEAPVVVPVVPEAPVTKPFVWPNFDTFLTNEDEISYEQLLRAYHVSNLQLGSNYGLERVDTRFSRNWSTNMTIEVPTSFSNTMFDGVKEVAEYYNQIFELAGMNQRFSVVRVSALSNTAEIEFKLSGGLKEKELAVANNLPSNTMQFGERRIGTVTMNANSFNEVEKEQQIYNLFRRVVLHEIGHILGIGHFTDSPSSLMAPSVPLQFTSYWKMTPNDIRIITSLLNSHDNKQEKVLLRDNFAVQAGYEYYESLLSYYQSEYISSVPQQNSVVHYSFEIGNKSPFVDTVNITLNQPGNGYYTFENIKDGQVIRSFSGKFYAYNKTNEHGKIAQTIFLENYYSSADGKLQTAAITAGKNGFQLTIGDTYTTRLKNLAGKAYSTEQERNQALINTLSAYEDVIKTPNITILIPKSAEETPLKQKETYNL